MKNDDLKFRWDKINAGWWYCRLHRLSVTRNKTTGRWRALGVDGGYEAAGEAMRACEERHIGADKEVVQ